MAKKPTKAATKTDAPGAKGDKQAGGTSGISSSESNNLVRGGVGSTRGGKREGSGRKPCEVKVLEREALDAKRKQVVTGKEVGIIEGCIARLWQIGQQNEDLGAAVKANEALLNRACGKPVQKIDLGDGNDGRFVLNIFPIGVTPPQVVATQ